jgi:hypothetical protein
MIVTRNVKHAFSYLRYSSNNGESLTVPVCQSINPILQLESPKPVLSYMILPGMLNIVCPVFFPHELLF